ncbi:MAG TPA: phosphotransferase [Chthonomonadaceae bacterium]|nr:phosphotransferase [Chthonomonadaceae bacterium]
MSAMPEPVNTLFDAEIIRNYVQAHYPLDALIGCELIRRGFNDTYRVATATGAYIFRVYFNAKYYIEGEGDFRFELEMLDFLAGQGVPVSAPIQRNDGDLLGTLPQGEDVRYGALFQYAEGKEREPLSVERATALGTALAKLHVAADRFQPAHRRYHLNLEYLVEKPVDQLRAAFRRHGRESDLDFLMPFLEAWQEPVRRLPVTPPAYGFIHGDPHNGNIRFTDDNCLTFFDFDHGGYGWRSYDLSVCKLGWPEEVWNAMLASYQAVRPLSPQELEAIPAFRKIRPIWDHGDILAIIPALGKPPPDNAYCDSLLEGFRRLAGI